MMESDYMLVVVPVSEAKLMMNQASAAYPEECCGLLLGVEDGVRRIKRVLSAKNMNYDSPRNRYRIDAENLIRADEEARRSSLNLIGIYHSHPDASTRLSRFDLDHAWPCYTYLVLSVLKGETRDLAAWFISEDRTRFQLEDLRVMGNCKNFHRTTLRRIHRAIQYDSLRCSD